MLEKNVGQLSRSSSSTCALCGASASSSSHCFFNRAACAPLERRDRRRGGGEAAEAGAGEGAAGEGAGRLRAPCDLPVQIASGGLTVFGRRFDLPIAGPGLVRVLYHDASMRIFESPDESQDKWGGSGLVVVQVRESLINS